MELRDYQRDWIDRIYGSWASGHKYIVAQMPTASGKTVGFVNIAVEFAAKNRRVLIITHREELLYQAIDKLAQFIPRDRVGVIKSRIPFDYSLPIQVASVATLTKRLAQVKNIDLIIIDECHHSNARTWKNILEKFPNALRLGVTATPVRLDGRSFRGIFTDLIPGITVKDAIECGYLSRYKLYASASKISTKSCPIVGGDYRIADLAAANNATTLAGDLIGSYHRHAEGRQGIVFAINLEHSQGIAARYNEAGIIAVHVDGQTPKKERFKILERFKRGEIQVLTNCNLFDEGVDLPAIGFVQIARPTLSLARYLQSIGRGLRPHPDKDFTVIIDHTDNYAVHGLPCTDRVWTLDGSRLKSTVVLAKDRDNLVVKVDRPTSGRSIIENNAIELIEIKVQLLDFELAQAEAVKRADPVIQAPSRSQLFNELVERRANIADWKAFAIEQGFDLDWANKNFTRFRRGEFNSKRTLKPYSPGQVIGNYGMKFVRELPAGLICDSKGNIRKRRKAVFACGFCGTEFDTTLNEVSCNHSRQCGCMIPFWQRMRSEEIAAAYKLPDRMPRS